MSHIIEFIDYDVEVVKSVKGNDITLKMICADSERNMEKDALPGMPFGHASTVVAGYPLPDH